MYYTKLCELIIQCKNSIIVQYFKLIQIHFITDEISIQKLICI